MTHSSPQDEFQQTYSKHHWGKQQQQQSRRNYSIICNNQQNGRHHPYLKSLPFPPKHNHICQCQLHHHVHFHSSTNLRQKNNKNQSITISITSRVARWTKWIMVCPTNSTTYQARAPKHMRTCKQCVWINKQQPNSRVLPCGSRVPHKTNMAGSNSLRFLCHVANVDRRHSH